MLWKGYSRIRRKSIFQQLSTSSKLLVILIPQHSAYSRCYTWHGRRERWANCKSNLALSTDPLSMYKTSNFRLAQQLVVPVRNAPSPISKCRSLLMLSCQILQSSQNLSLAAQLQGCKLPVNRGSHKENFLAQSSS